MAILSLFPGIDLLGRAFEEEGFCVVRGPDKILGQDIRSFTVESHLFEGVIAGTPCQDFSLLRRGPPTGYGREMIAEFSRVVTEAKPDWWMLENVATVPDVKIPGYSWQRFDINQGWYSEYSRLRHIQFGSVDGIFLNVTRRGMNSIKGGAALANDDRSFKELCHIQGLPPEFDLPDFNVKGKKKVVGNGVPLAIGRVLAREVVTALRQKKGDGPGLICACECGRSVTGRQRYYSATCRKRAQRKRDSAGGCGSSIGNF